MNRSVVKTSSNNLSNSVSSGYRSTKNAAANTFNNFRAASLFVQIIIVIIIIFVLVLLFMWLRHLYYNSQNEYMQNPLIITSPINAFSKSGNPVIRRSIPFPTEGLAFSYSLWIYIADWNYNFGSWKNIFQKGSNDNRSPGLWLYPKTNSLHARIRTSSDMNEGCDINNIPLQKWVHIVYVLNNRAVDIYIDGKLERSCVLKGVPILNNDQLLVGNEGGFFGQIAKMQYFTRALIPSEIASIYSEGPFISSGYSFSLFDSKKSSSSSNSDNGDDNGNGGNGNCS